MICWDWLAIFWLLYTFSFLLNNPTSLTMGFTEQAVLNVPVAVEHSKEVNDYKHLIKTLVMGNSSFPDNSVTIYILWGFSCHSLVVSNVSFCLSSANLCSSTCSLIFYAHGRYEDNHLEHHSCTHTTFSGLCDLLELVFFSEVYPWSMLIFQGCLGLTFHSWKPATGGCISSFRFFGSTTI